MENQRLINQVTSQVMPKKQRGARPEDMDRSTVPGLVIPWAEGISCRVELKKSRSSFKSMFKSSFSGRSYDVDTRFDNMPEETSS